MYHSNSYFFPTFKNIYIQFQSSNIIVTGIYSILIHVYTYTVEVTHDVITNLITAKT